MTEPIGEITIRMLGQGDRDAVEALAERDSAAVPVGRLLGASVDGRLVVAHSLATGAQIADPFTKTEEIRGLVEERASHLNGVKHRRRHRFGRRSRAALHGSPPGGGGRLLTLPQRAV